MSVKGGGVRSQNTQRNHLAPPNVDICPFSQKYMERMMRINALREERERRRLDDPLEARSEGTSFYTPAADAEKVHKSKRGFGLVRPLSAGRAYPETRDDTHTVLQERMRQRSPARQSSYVTHSRRRSLSADGVPRGSTSCADDRSLGNNQNQTNNIVVSNNDYDHPNLQFVGPHRSRTRFDKEIEVQRSKAAVEKQQQIMQQLKRDQRKQRIKSKGNPDWVPSGNGSQYQASQHKSVNKNAAQKLLQMKAWRRSPWPGHIPPDENKRACSSSPTKRHQLAADPIVRVEGVFDAEEEEDCNHAEGSVAAYSFKHDNASIAIDAPKANAISTQNDTYSKDGCRGEEASRAPFQQLSSAASIVSRRSQRSSRLAASRSIASQSRYVQPLQIPAKIINNAKNAISHSILRVNRQCDKTELLATIEKQFSVAGKISDVAISVKIPYGTDSKRSRNDIQSLAMGTMPDFPSLNEHSILTVYLEGTLLFTTKLSETSADADRPIHESTIVTDGGSDTNSRIPSVAMSTHRLQFTSGISDLDRYGEHGPATQLERSLGVTQENERGLAPISPATQWKVERRLSRSSSGAALAGRDSLYFFGSMDEKPAVSDDLRVGLTTEDDIFFFDDSPNISPVPARSSLFSPLKIPPLKKLSSCSASANENRAGDEKQSRVHNVPLYRSLHPGQELHSFSGPSEAIERKKNSVNAVTDRRSRPYPNDDVSPLQVYEPATSTVPLSPLTMSTSNGSIFSRLHVSNKEGNRGAAAEIDNPDGSNSVRAFQRAAASSIVRSALQRSGHFHDAMGRSELASPTIGVLIGSADEGVYSNYAAGPALTPQQPPHDREDTIDADDATIDFADPHSDAAKMYSQMYNKQHDRNRTKDHKSEEEDSVLFFDFDAAQRLNDASVAEPEHLFDYVVKLPSDDLHSLLDSEQPKQKNSFRSEPENTLQAANFGGGHQPRKLTKRRLIDNEDRLPPKRNVDASGGQSVTSSTMSPHLRAKLQLEASGCLNDLDQHAIAAVLDDVEALSVGRVQPNPTKPAVKMALSESLPQEVKVVEDFCNSRDDPPYPKESSHESHPLANGERSNKKRGASDEKLPYTLSDIAFNGLLSRDMEEDEFEKHSKKGDTAAPLRTIHVQSIDEHSTTSSLSYPSVLHDISSPGSTTGHQKLKQSNLKLSENGEGYAPASEEIVKGTKTQTAAASNPVVAPDALVSELDSSPLTPAPTETKSTMPFITPDSIDDNEEVDEEEEEKRIEVELAELRKLTRPITMTKHSQGNSEQRPLSYQTPTSAVVKDNKPDSRKHRAEVVDGSSKPPLSKRATNAVKGTKTTELAAAMKVSKKSKSSPISSTERGKVKTKKKIVTKKKKKKSSKDKAVNALGAASGDLLDVHSVSSIEDDFASTDSPPLQVQSESVDCSAHTTNASDAAAAINATRSVSRGEMSVESAATRSTCESRKNAAGRPLLQHRASRDNSDDDAEGGARGGTGNSAPSALREGSAGNGANSSKSGSHRPARQLHLTLDDFI